MDRIKAIAFAAITTIVCATTNPTLAAGRDAKAASLPLPAGYIYTPDGLYHQSCIHRLAPGDRFDAKGVVIHANGQQEVLPPCAYQRLNVRTHRPIAPGNVAPDVGQWIETAKWTTPSATPVGSIQATFVVPPAPAAPGGIIQFFIGAEPNDQSRIVQTVLEYDGTSSPGAWAAFGMVCCPGSGGTPFMSQPLTVQPGQTITASITSSCPGSGDCSCTLTMSAGGATTTLTGACSTALSHVYGATLEVQPPFAACNQLPVNPGLTFSGITMTDLNGNPLTPCQNRQPCWFPKRFPLASPLPSCGYGVVASPQTPSTITLQYQSQ